MECTKVDAVKTKAAPEMCDSKIPTSYMVRVNGSKKWARVYCYRFLFGGRPFVDIDGDRFLIDESELTL